jgi:hypothetical protein
MIEVLPVDQSYGHYWMLWRDWETDVPWASMNVVLPQYVQWPSMNEVLPRDQSYSHYWMLWLGDRCSMGIDEWSATQGPAGHMAIIECCDLKTDVPYVKKLYLVIIHTHYCWTHTVVQYRTHPLLLNTHRIVQYLRDPWNIFKVITAKDAQTIKLIKILKLISFFQGFSKSTIT